eukprot:CAMPEP_0115738588 /NCGR_PEP_ID=MMETSP0272-20121206/88465_1 /TAXON_ID=71861 /ORGANISM="Scrippsiella trochoidea, Strain CCMP3099" /LENGTH=30 /DNA_ID= /DNA_START= /DNA_END= /DNA_ORIENTATION=
MAGNFELDDLHEPLTGGQQRVPQLAEAEGR